jgi:hypothetical protein
MNILHGEGVAQLNRITKNLHGLVVWQSYTSIVYYSQQKKVGQNVNRK